MRMGQDALLACSQSNSRLMLGQETKKGQPDQITALKDLWPRPSLITVTIGGNDVGFADALEDCYLSAPDGGCVLDGTLGQIAAKIDNEQGQLYDDYKAIENAEPSATLLVVGYPRLFPQQQSEDSECSWLLNDERVTLNKLDTQLNTKIRAAATQVGARYVNVTDALAGHEACTKDSWIFPVGKPDWPQGGSVVQQYGHPTKPGQEAIARIVRTYIQQHLRLG